MGINALSNLILLYLLFTVSTGTTLLSVISLDTKLTLISGYRFRQKTGKNCSDLLLVYTGYVEYSMLILLVERFVSIH